MKLDNVEFLKFANSFADISGSILKKSYFKKFKIEEKVDGSLVTEIDKKLNQNFDIFLKRNTLIMVLLVKNLVIIKRKVSIFG